MKRLLSVLLMALLVFTMTACGGSGGGAAQGAESTLTKIQNDKKLVVGTSPGYLPFEMQDTSGKFIGYDIDLAYAIGEALGLEEKAVEIKQYEFSGLIPALQTGDIDIIIAAMTIRGDRALAVSFSDPYFATGQVLMVTGSDTTTKTWEDLDKAGNKIATSQGTTGGLLSHQLFKNAEVADFPDFASASMAVSQGKAQGLLYDEPGIRMFEIMHPNEVRGIYDIISSENLGLVVKYNDQEMVNWLNSFLQGYVNTPREMDSRTKWFETTDWMDTLQN